MKKIGIQPPSILSQLLDLLSILLRNIRRRLHLKKSRRNLIQSALGSPLGLPINTILFDLDDTLHPVGGFRFVMSLIINFLKEVLFPDSFQARYPQLSPLTLNVQQEKIVQLLMKKWSHAWNKVIEAVPGDHWLLWHVMENWSRTRINHALHSEAVWSVWLDQSTIAVLKDLKSRGIRLFILSNTPLTARKTALELFLNSQNLENLFEGIYDVATITQIAREKYGWSSRIPLKKPHPLTYQIVSDLHDIEPSRCVSVDDAFKNIVSSQIFGFQTAFADPVAGYIANITLIKFILENYPITTSAP